MVVYNAHLEVFCGLLARIALLSDMFADARRMADQGLHQQAILGDLNTMAHGIARLSPSHCNDHMRFRSVLMPASGRELVAPQSPVSSTAAYACATPLHAEISAWMRQLCGSGTCCQF